MAHAPAGSGLEQGRTRRERAAGAQGRAAAAARRAAGASLPAPAGTGAAGPEAWMPGPCHLLPRCASPQPSSLQHPTSLLRFTHDGYSDGHIIGLELST